ncbi:MAG: hypothetical protein HY261_02600 [Chloroflexi bacterium]|nr:hypothetical protein [Chloroflexota bacterium]
MNPLRFSQDARRLLALAHQAAVESGARAVEQEHLALACLRDPATGLVAALNEIGASPDTLRDALAQTIGSRPLGATGAIVEPSPAFEAFLHSAWEAARAQQRHHVVAIHLIDDQGLHSQGAQPPQVQPLPHRPRRRWPPRPCHRARPGNPPRHAGALATSQKQPGADRQARRRQDLDSRRPRRAHRSR